MERKSIAIKDKSFTIGLMENGEMRTLYPLIEVLNADMTQVLFEKRLAEMQANNFNCIGIWENDALIACCGFWVLVKFYNGKHVEPDNVVVLPEYRNFGLGQVMMDFLHEHAVKLGCGFSELNAYIGNDKAHRFYFKDGYKIIAFHFRKTL
jgi:GNAT superfamily N-acetyltransferase